MGWRDKVAGSDGKGGGKGDWIRVGEYLLELDVLKEHESQEGDDLVIAEFKVLESAYPDQPKGSTVSRIWNMTRHKPAPGNVKKFLMAAMGAPGGELEAEEINAKMIDFALDEKKNPLVGATFKCFGSNTKTKAKKDFTVCKWELVTNAPGYLEALEAFLT